MSEPVIKEPKELRFTRSHQAVMFAALGAGVLAVAGGLLVLHFQHLGDRPSWWWALAPLPFAAACFWLAWNQTRRAFLVISRIGVEIYPFLLPARNMNLVMWSEIEDAEVTADGNMMILTLGGLTDSKIFVTLKPLARRSRPLVAESLRRVMEFKRSAQNSETESVCAATLSDDNGKS